MDGLKLVVNKTGLPEATAKTTVETVIGFLEKKLPHSIPPSRLLLPPPQLRN